MLGSGANGMRGADGAAGLVPKGSSLLGGGCQGTVGLLYKGWEKKPKNVMVNMAIAGGIGDEEGSSPALS